MSIGIDKILEEFGAVVDWRENPVITQANILDAIFIRNNPDRLQFTIINLSGSNIFIRPSQAALTGTGIVLVANGGNFSVNVKDDGPLPIIEWHVIGLLDNLDIYVLEIIGISSLT